MNNLMNFFNALSDETRLRIIMLIYNKELCVCEMCEILGLPQPKVSRHLSKLRDMGLVRDERQNQWIFYYLNIKDEQMLNFIKDINDNSLKYDVIYNDVEKLRKKISMNKMCGRNK